MTVNVEANKVCIQKDKGYLINETWWSANHGEWRWNDKDRANSVKVMAVKNKKRILKDFTSPNKYSRFSLPFNLISSQGLTLAQAKY